MSRKQSVAAIWACAILPASFASPAVAGTITQTYDFSFNIPAGGPVSIWSGDFTVTYDPALTNTVRALDDFESNLGPAYGSDWWFVYNAGIYLQVGNSCNTNYCTYIHSKNTAYFLFEPSLVPGGFIEATLNTAVGFIVQQTPGSVSLRGVPEPLTLSIFGAGIAGAVAMRRRKRPDA